MKVATEENGEFKTKLQSEEVKKSKPIRAKKKQKITWVGTSVSNVMDKDKFEHETEMDLSVVKAHGIEEEGRFKGSNLTAVVPDVVKKEDTDVLVLQAGDIELTNIDVVRAIDDEDKDIDEYKKEWYLKAEKDSENLFSIAESAIATDLELNVVIVKRIQRFDKTSVDPIGIKSQLSKFANHVYDQLWLKRGEPTRIHIVDLNLDCEDYPYFKEILYGRRQDRQFDGIHLNGTADTRQFTYRAIQAIRSRFTKPPQMAARHWSVSDRNRPIRSMSSSDHRNCPQTKYQEAQRQLARNRRKDAVHTRTYAEVASSSTEHVYSVPTRNFYNPLNRFPSLGN